MILIKCFLSNIYDFLELQITPTILPIPGRCWMSFIVHVLFIINLIKLKFVCLLIHLMIHIFSLKSSIFFRHKHKKSMMEYKLIFHCSKAKKDWTELKRKDIDFHTPGWYFSLKKIPICLMIWTQRNKKNSTKKRERNQWNKFHNGNFSFTVMTIRVQ